MDPQETQTWVIFYLVSFLVLLVALFFTTQGLLLGLGMTLIIVVVGLNFYIIWNEIKRVNKKKELMQRLCGKNKK
ncbi:hypothetical protein J2128_000221 [Methanomicrobium sp. W14]|uniref:hypothetical protein n=1 Tax=Methanomicrobium sp. W14 TaxID=2817839 RepID=UPI001AE29D8B|nr:hypothetical protein [Methanomicrobium sp. W14]MBP2132300.1 hypothetical protein [Methanomicrobium sp. W14]